ncbi:alpha/beta hydrolase [Ulvibacterium sp.]|uniref:alpha/beta hydrolase n=1 Tax=Ulvibacterium sp. TaxID=2665914 RepID=UPI003BABB845
MTVHKYTHPILGVLLFLTFGTNYAQERYLDLISSDIGRVTYTYSDSLKLDFYSIKGDTVIDKPLLVLVHGGGFAIGKRDNVLESKFSRQMAKKGYAVASISYRLTRKGKSFGCDCPTNEKIETFLAVSEDVLKATQYLVDRAGDLRFDKNNVILIGSSAGAEAVLNTAFMQFRHDFRTLPYEGLTFSGVISLAGAVLDVDYITQKNTIPTMLFHGEKDNLVPFASASHHYCKETDPGYLPLDGSSSIADRLEALDTSYTLVFDPEGNHDWANLPYSYTDMISRFIKKNIIDGEYHQTKIKVSSKK